MSARMQEHKGLGMVCSPNKAQYLHSSHICWQRIRRIWYFVDFDDLSLLNNLLIHWESRTKPNPLNFIRAEDGKGGKQLKSISESFNLSRKGTNTPRSGAWVCHSLIHHLSVRAVQFFFLKADSWIPSRTWDSWTVPCGWNITTTQTLEITEDRFYSFFFFEKGNCIHRNIFEIHL